MVFDSVKCAGCGKVFHLCASVLRSRREAHRRNGFSGRLYCSRTCFMASRRRRPAMAASVVALLSLLALTAADWNLRITAPCFEERRDPNVVDGLGCYAETLAVENGLDSLLVYGWRFGDPDTIRLGALPARGMECRDIDFTVAILPGTMGEILIRAKDLAGNVSCGQLHYVFAIPAVDSTVAAALSPYYTLTVRSK